MNSNSLMTLDEERTASFKPRARLLLQLGDQLIKNESIAVLELVKNSYDADASWVKVTMNHVDSMQEGSIVIEDNGFGMTSDIVENVWLEPGSSFKLNLVSNGERTPKYHRLPIGEKGIGRFGAHKLGHYIEMTTKSALDREVCVKIDWREFEDKKYLEDVPITISVRSTPVHFTEGRTGTRIVIRDLYRDWDRGTVRDVRRAITSLTSPFDSLDSFKPEMVVLGKPEWLDGLMLWDQVKDYSLYHFKVMMSGDKIRSFKYDFCPWPTMTKSFPRSVDLQDPYIENFVTLRDSNNTHLDLGIYKIGEVVFEGYVFDMDPFVLRMGVSDKRGFKDYLRYNGGIRVFRDGLRVYDYGEPENDWLSLDYRRFQRPTKAISNNLVLGAIYLNREHSANLEEKTNREGFVENEAYKAFKSAILYVLELVETLRMSDKKKLKEIYGPTSKSEPVMSVLSDAIQYVENSISDGDVKEEIKKYLYKIERDYKQITDTLLKAAGAGLNMSVVVHEIEKIIFELKKVLQRDSASERALKLVMRLSDLVDGYASIIRRSDMQKEDLDSAVNQALFNTEFRLEAHRISLDKLYTSDEKRHLQIQMSRNLFVGTIMNLLDNSIYWLDQRAFRMAEESKPYQKKIAIDIQSDDCFAYVIVADNGTGFLIPTEESTEPFVSGRSGGMGLGLHIASEVAKALGGFLSFPDAQEFGLPQEYDGAVVVVALKK